MPRTGNCGSKTVEQRLDPLRAKFDEHFARSEEGNELLGFPGSYELRGEIRASLGDLRRGVGGAAARGRATGASLSMRVYGVRRRRRDACDAVRALRSSSPGPGPASSGRRSG